MRSRKQDMREAISYVAEAITKLTISKNESYGDSFAVSGKILELLYPDGVQPHQYRDMLAVARVIDKLGRIANRKDAFGESPWQDICGYGLVASAVEFLEQRSGSGDSQRQAD